MTNGYFDEGDYTPLTDHTLGRAAGPNAITTAIVSGFDLLPSEENIKQGKVTYAADSGAANAYVVALPHAPGSYAAGLFIIFRATNANTGASTINASALGVKAIKRADGTDLSADDITAGQMVMIVYDATGGYFRMAGQQMSDVTAAAASASSAATSASSASSSASSASSSASSASSSASSASASASSAAGAVTTHAALTSTHGVTGSIVGTGGSQSITGQKTFTAPILGAATATTIALNGGVLTGGYVLSVKASSANITNFIALTNTSSQVGITGDDTSKYYAFRTFDGTAGWLAGLGNAALGAATGDYAIATNGGTHRLNITQAGIVTMSGYGAGTATFSSAGVISSVSDVRVKKDFRPFTRGVAALRATLPQTYRYNGADDHKDDPADYTGYVIDDAFQEALPEAVYGPKTKGGYRSLWDRAILAAIHNAVVAHDDELLTLRERCARLEALVASSMVGER